MKFPSWIPRSAADRLRSLASSFPAVLVSGAQQTGKTTLVRRVFPRHHYVTLDLRLLAEEAQEAPDAFLAAHPPPLIIDEVEYAPELFRHLKVAIDGACDRKGQFILTGSQKFPLMKEVSESLAGRCALFALPGLALDEIRKTGWSPAEVDAQVELLVRGGFPELWADRSIPSRAFHQSYVATYLERDLLQVLRVGSLRDFERFLRAAAARAGQLLNKSELARDVGISQPTASEWLSALEVGNQLVLLEPYFGSVGKRLAKSPKIYFQDTGLLCFLLGLSRDSLATSPLRGAVWENFVLMEIRKWLDLHRPEWRLWFYRDRNREADFIVQGPFERVRVLDAKWAEVPGRDALAALEPVAATLRNARGIRDVEVGIVARSTRSHSLGAKGSIVSGFRIPEFLGRSPGARM